MLLLNYEYNEIERVNLIFLVLINMRKNEKEQ